MGKANRIVSLRTTPTAIPEEERAAIPMGEANRIVSLGITPTAIIEEERAAIPMGEADRIISLRITPTTIIEEEYVAIPRVSKRLAPGLRGLIKWAEEERVIDEGELN